MVWNLIIILFKDKILLLFVKHRFKENTVTKRIISFDLIWPLRVNVIQSEGGRFFCCFFFTFNAYIHHIIMINLFYLSDFFLKKAVFFRPVFYKQYSIIGIFFLAKSIMLYLELVKIHEYGMKNELQVWSQ